MMCYRDESFCSAYPDRCANETCHRAFTLIEEEQAAKWWGGKDAPVAFMDFSPGCSILEVPEETPSIV